MCLIVAGNFPEGIVLAKNRDTEPPSPIHLVHTLVGDTEVLYLHDLKSGWVEGLNQYGIGIVNAEILHDGQTKGSEIAINHKLTKLSGYSANGKKMLRALSNQRVEEAAQSLTEYQGLSEQKGLGGNSLIVSPVNPSHPDTRTNPVHASTSHPTSDIAIWHSENYLGISPSLHRIHLQPEKVVSFTNYPTFKQMSGKPDSMTELRHQRLKNNLTRMDGLADFFHVMRLEQQDSHPSTNIYRAIQVGNDYSRLPYPQNLVTTSQLFLHLTHRHLTLVVDTRAGRYQGYHSSLPPDKKPTITFTVFGNDGQSIRLLETSLNV